MKNCLVDSISNLKSKPFSGFSVKYLKIPKRWPVSISHENIYKNGKAVPFFAHKKTAEFVYVIRGKAKAYLGNKIIDVSGGDYLLIPPGIKHRFVTGRKPLVALSVFCPSMTLDNLDAVMCKSGGNKKRNSSGKLKRLPVQNK